MLTALGATDSEDRVYRYLATTVSATVGEIAASTGLSASLVDAAVAGLVGSGLVSRTPDAPARFVASSPGTVEAMIFSRLNELRAAQETLDRIAGEYRASHAVREADGIFEVIRGSEALRQHMFHLLRSARSEALNMVKPPIVAVRSGERVTPGEDVRGRLIFETDSIGSAEDLDAIRQDLRGQDEIRVHTKLPIKMLAIDRSVAFVPLAQNDTTPIGVLIYESAVLDALLALFDYVWATAVPLHVDNPSSSTPPGQSPLSAEDRQLLSLLLSGLTDEAIAAHFRVSVRTVQRKVRALMEVANVRTRMQLAWEAARQAWV
jgi:sugar-specific transcriptional regulator TrmB/DNA-binding CsgD family transcriptional regulator